MHRNVPKRPATIPILAAIFAPRSLLAVAATIAISVAAHHNLDAQQPLPLTHGNQSPAMLQLRSDVEVNSFIVRVGDVVAPISDPPEGWRELSRKAIALLPSDGRRMRMERQRIAECLERSGLLRTTTLWTGPGSVAVAYVPHVTPIEYSAPNAIAAAFTAPNNQPRLESNSRPVVTPGLRQDAVGHASFRKATEDPNGITSVRTVQYSKPAHPNLFPAERNRIERMILAAFPKTHAEVLNRFEVAVSPEDQGINGLKDLRAVRSLRLSETPHEGRLQLWVAGETEYHQVEAVVDIDLLELPVVVFTTTSLNRGDILTERDLVAKPISRHQYDSSFVSDVESLLNKEMVRTLSTDRPVKMQDVREPVIIKRGDRVELRVVGAGVTVVTAAKALAPAAAGESVMVETESPKQKIAARAVKPGLVEILSRPPTTKELGRF